MLFRPTYVFDKVKDIEPEFLKVRGGDIHAFAAFKQQLEENGSCRTSSLDPNTIPRSAVTMSSILKSMYIDNNLV